MFFSGVRPALSKSSRLASLLHSSTTFKEGFEQNFGASKSIPACNATRWNSVLRQTQSVIALSHRTLTDLSRTQSHTEIIFSVKEWHMLKELSELLNPFLEATNLTQGECIPTITCVVPTVLALNSHLNRCKSTIKYLQLMVNALKSALLKRFSGIFTTCSIASSSDKNLDANVQLQPFEDSVYFLACTLDPIFTFKWLIDVDATAADKDALRAKITGRVNLKNDKFFCFNVKIFIFLAQK